MTMVVNKVIMSSYNPTPRRNFFSGLQAKPRSTDPTIKGDDEDEMRSKEGTRE